MLDFINNYMVSMKFVRPVLNVTKKKRIQSKQLINGTRYLQDSQFSIKIYRNLQDWANELEVAHWITNDLYQGLSFRLGNRNIPEKQLCIPDSSFF